MERLKPCPFCGKIPMLEIIPPHTHSPWLKSQLPELPDCEGAAFVECACSAAMSGDNADDVTKKWNRRVTNECITERAIRMNIVKEIIQERNRQVTDEGYSVQHDDKLDAGQLAEAGSVYASARIDRAMRYPAGWVFKPAERRRELIKAAALIIAELERLYRRADDGKEILS